MTTKTQQAMPAWRFSLIAMLLVCLAALLVWRVLSLQVMDTQFLKGQGDARNGHQTDRHSYIDQNLRGN